MFCDPYTRNRMTGGLILVDEATNVTVGAAMIADARLSRRSRPGLARCPGAGAQRAIAAMPPRWPALSGAVRYVATVSAVALPWELLRYDQDPGSGPRQQQMTG